MELGGTTKFLVDFNWRKKQSFACHFQDVPAFTKQVFFVYHSSKVPNSIRSLLAVRLFRRTVSFSTVINQAAIQATQKARQRALLYVFLFHSILPVSA